MTLLRRYGFALLVATAVLFPFVFYSSDMQSRKNLSAVEKVVYAFSAPVEFVFRFGTGHVKDALAAYVDLRGAKEEAKRLSEENAKLAVQLQVAGQLENENQRLRTLLDFSRQGALRFLMAQVQSADPSFLYRSIRLGRGENDGVAPGMAVVAAAGAVGMVMRTVSDASDVLLVTDPNANLDVIVARNRRRGILVGGTGNVMQFKYFDRGTRLLVGDEIVTSGLTGAFPRGIAVGRVSRIKVEEGGASQTIEVEPSVNFAEVSEALILLKPSREVEVIRKVGGLEWMKRMMEGGADKRSGG
ncbi:MAG: rod shape-determining protein MreC [Silvanigrellales bacterium]|jgi:rod shape-determining protein MreC|nr:rod shape-determining protein MreC [Silvanigrellales bacterium]